MTEVCVEKYGVKVNVLVGEQHVAIGSLVRAHTSGCWSAIIMIQNYGAVSASWTEVVMAIATVLAVGYNVWIRAWISLHIAVSITTQAYLPSSSSRVESQTDTLCEIIN